MVELYTATNIQPEVFSIKTAKEIKHHLNRLQDLIDYATHTSYLFFPCKLIAFPEFFLQGHLWSTPAPKAIDKLITIPGEETDKIGEKAKQHNLYIVGAAYAAEPDFPRHYFNIGFIIGPNGKIISKYYKIGTNNGIETACSPHDVWDEFVRKKGNSLNAFFPVVDTEIGRIAVFLCYDGVFPEIARGFAVNGAEVLVHSTAWPDPYITEPEDYWALMNRARAYENCCYLIAPNWGINPSPTPGPRNMWSGDSMIVDYQGRIMARASKTGETLVSALINIEELRAWRSRTTIFNFIPGIRSEIFAKIYKKPFWPKNMYLEKQIVHISENQSVHRDVRKQLIEKGIFKAPKESS